MKEELKSLVKIHTILTMGEDLNLKRLIKEHSDKIYPVNLTEEEMLEIDEEVKKDFENIAKIIEE
jgi:hypothetical protein